MLKVDPTRSDTLPLPLPFAGRPEDLPKPKLRPTLTPPSEFRFLGVSNDTRDIGNALLDVFSERLECIKATLSEISAQNIDKLKETAERTLSSRFWNTLKNLATAFLSSLSTILGISLIANGGSALIGGAMIASGVLSLANFGLNEIKAWDWVAEQLAQDNEDRKRQLAALLPAVVGLLAAGIGLAGSAWSLATNAVQFTDKAVQIAQAALSTFTGITALGKGCADARLSWTQADLIDIQGKLTTERAAYTSLIEGIGGSLIEFRAMSARTTQAIKTITASNIMGVRL